MSNIYFYKMTVDNGGAPCIERGLLSLAICKPMIRSSAQIGDILIGFTATSLNKNNPLIYIARVTDKICHGNYFKLGTFHSRVDCIYEWRGHQFAPRPGAKYHGNPGDLLHDLGKAPTYSRANTLLSKEFCYFGANGTDAYKTRFPKVAARVRLLKQGHRVEHDPALLHELDQMVVENCGLDRPCRLGNPTNPAKKGCAQRGGGCAVVERVKSC